MAGRELQGLEFKGMSHSDIVERFQYQMSENDCFSTCLFNIISTYQAVTGSRRDPRLSKRRVNEICQFDRRFGVVGNFDIIAQELNHEFRGMSCPVQSEYSVDEGSIEKLQKILLDNRTSFPIVTFSGRYFSTHHSRRRVVGTKIPNHCVVPLSFTDEEFYIHDPLVGYRRPRDEADRDAINTIPEAVFLSLWREADTSYELFWLSQSAVMLEVFSE